MTKATGGRKALDHFVVYEDGKACYSEEVGLARGARLGSVPP